MRVLEEDAKLAFEIVRTIIDEAFPNGEKTSTVICINHEQVKIMRKLIEKVRFYND